MKHLLINLLTLTLCGIPLISIAQTRHPGMDPQDGLDRAVRQVEERTGGQVLAAEQRRIDDAEKYRIKVLTPQGRVRVIYVDR